MALVEGMRWYICNTHQCGEVGATTCFCNLGATNHLYDWCTTRLYITMSANRTLYRVSCPILCVISSQVQCFLAVREHIHPSQTLLKCLSSMEPPRSVLCRGLSTLEVEDLTSSRVRCRLPSWTGTCRGMRFIYICNTHQCGEVGATTWLCNLGAVFTPKITSQYSRLKSRHNIYALSHVTVFTPKITSQYSRLKSRHSIHA